MNQTYSIGNKHYEGTPVDKHIYIYTHVHMCIYMYVYIMCMYIHINERPLYIYMYIPFLLWFFWCYPKETAYYCLNMLMQFWFSVTVNISCTVKTLCLDMMSRSTGASERCLKFFSPTFRRFMYGEPKTDVKLFKTSCNRLQ